MSKTVTYHLSPVTFDQGFTMLEALTGTVLATILLTAITPAIVMSTAIRVQSKRIEMASKIARTFIDGVRIGSIQKPTIVSQLAATQNTPRNITTAPDDYLFNTSEMPPPLSPGELYCADKNGIIKNTNCENNLFYIQAGRITQSNKKNDGYRLAIRVYRNDIDFSQPIKINTGSETRKTASPVTASIGDKQAPLIEITTDIANQNTKFYALCQRLGIAINTPEPKSCK